MIGFEGSGTRALAILGAWCGLLLGSGCNKQDPLYCCTTAESCSRAGGDGVITPCTDPDRPYCDDQGYFAEWGRSCIPQPAGQVCGTAAECPAGQPVCLDHVCVQCEDDSQCAQACNTATHTCQGCTVDEDCAATPDTPRCLAEDGLCVACLGGDDCAADTPVCSAHACVACTDSEGCGGDSPICLDGLCVQCVGSEDCSGDTPICVDSACVQCAAAGDCGDAAPICEDNVCRRCRADAECASDVCDEEEGVCLDQDAVLYVARNGAANSMCTREALCSSFGRALDLVSGTRNVIKAAPGTYTGSIEIDGITVTILADGATVQPAAENLTAVSVSGGADATIEGLTITGARGPAAPTGMTCNGASSVLRLRRSIVINNTGGGGISISGCEFSLVNNVIALNGAITSAFGGVSIAQVPIAGLHEFSFNTITGNGGATNAITGVECLGILTPLTFSNNIVFDNQVSGTGTQVGGDSDCSWRYSDIGPQTVAGTGNINQDPQFVDVEERDVHLRPTSPARNAADPDATLARDLDGDNRPEGNRHDMGADEVTP